MHCISRKATCYDNAVAESIFRTVNEEGIGQVILKAIACDRELAFSFIAGFYNAKRLHSTLGFRTPFEEEKLDIMSRNQQGKR